MIVAATGAPPALGASVKLAGPSEAGCIGSENSATALAPTATALAPGAGWRAVRVGAVASTVASSGATFVTR